MKLQLQAHSLRVRIDEGELAALLAGDELALALQSGSNRLLDLRVVMADALAFRVEGSQWHLRLPESAVRAYVATLPCRDALSLSLGDELALDFEVDVRDSIRARGAKRTKN